ncbi:hypothetical protein PSP6_390049 [Paraburkholderia tropica]|nr:hypothetical protein PSP6_390049 [Paraburkholderia tropica]
MPPQARSVNVSARGGEARQAAERRRIKQAGNRHTDASLKQSRASRRITRRKAQWKIR